jgi:hypothetical protein
MLAGGFIAWKSSSTNMIFAGYMLLVLCLTANLLQKILATGIPRSSFYGYVAGFVLLYGNAVWYYLAALTGLSFSRVSFSISILLGAGLFWCATYIYYLAFKQTPAAC